MAYLVQVVLWGALGVAAYDAAAALAARRLGVPFVVASAGSLLLYAAVGWFAARPDGSLESAALAGALVGVFDLIVGWEITAALGPGLLPEEAQAPAVRIPAGVVSVLLASALAVAGGMVA